MNDQLTERLADSATPLTDYDIELLEMTYPERALDVWLTYVDLYGDDVEDSLSRQDMLRFRKQCREYRWFKQREWERLREKGLLQ
jgi:hypothetical protein